VYGTEFSEAEESQNTLITVKRHGNASSRSDLCNSKRFIALN